MLWSSFNREHGHRSRPRGTQIIGRKNLKCLALLPFVALQLYLLWNFDFAGNNINNFTTNTLDNILENGIKTAVAAQAAVAFKKHQNISRPSCFDDGTECGYDEIGKYLEASSLFTMVHKPSDAIPTSRRIPSHQGNNETYIASRRTEGPIDGSLTAIVEYNPTILPLTFDMDKKLLDYLTGRYHPDISDEEADKVKYLSIARGGNFHHCVPMRRNGNPTKEQSYLTLALLDEHLRPIPGASAAARPFQILISAPCYDKASLDYFQDFQIIAMRSTKGNDKKDQLFMISSDNRSYIFVLDIRRVPAPTNDGLGWDTKVKGTPVKMITPEGENSTLFYGSGLQIRFLHSKGKGARCQRLQLDNALDWRKNYHIFEAQDSKSGDIKTYMETRPFGNPRAFREVNFYANKFHRVGDWELVLNGTFQNPETLCRDVKDHKETWQSGPVVKDNWNHPFNNWNDGGIWERNWRGTACCVDLEWFNGEPVKVGIAHTVSKKRGYISKFYAFETKTKQFSIRATSGPFCLGSMKAYDHYAETQIFSHPDRLKLNISGVEFDCPHITFASGIAEYQADKNYVVISYGVNDCYSRSIVVSKERILEFLSLNRHKTNTTAQLLRTS